MNLFNFFTKPDVTPPTTNNEPDFSEFDPLVEKYEHYLKNSMEFFDELPKFGKIKLAFDDLIFMNLKSINYYLDNECYNGDFLVKKKMEEHIKTLTAYGTFCGWAVGREWGLKDRHLLNKLKHKSKIKMNEVPSDALILLHKATYFPYWIFTLIFDDYYKSSIGSKSSYQKTAHYKDTYRSLLNGILMCFLDGIKSSESLI